MTRAYFFIATAGFFLWLTFESLWLSASVVSALLAIISAIESSSGRNWFNKKRHESPYGAEYPEPEDSKPDEDEP